MMDDLRQFISQSRSLRLSHEKLLTDLTAIDCIIVVGSTCTGKSTLVNAVRDAAGCMDVSVDVPVRYITRPPRANDDLTENRHVAPTDFEAMVHQNKLEFHWVRRMEVTRYERYGFTRPVSDSFPIYSGNNALFSNPEAVRPERALDHALVLGVYAPQDVRTRRFQDRSPDLVVSNPQEVVYRLSDPVDSVIPHAHLVVHNHGANEAFALEEIVELVERAAFTATIVPI